MSKSFVFLFALLTCLTLAFATFPVDEVDDDDGFLNIPVGNHEHGTVATGYQVVLVPYGPTHNPDKCSCSKLLSKIEAKIAAIEAKILNLTIALENIHSSLEVDTVKIGRWRFSTATDDGSLIITDTLATNGERYKFPVGGNSDMYKVGQGGEIQANRIVFPTLWSIGEESVSYLVFRYRGVPSQDYRYAMAANIYRDL